MTRTASWALAALFLAGCAGAPRFDTSTISPAELVDVPFFPQTDYQCGPAALATILAYEGLDVDAARLAPAVYVEGLRGSLQAELLGATRRHGLIPYPLAPDPAALFAEVEAGKPVLVLQNLGLPRVPVWHYAVVVGFDRERGNVVLRSGTERRREESLRRFLKSWDRAERWAFVAAQPSAPPATATPGGYVRALAGAERMLPSAAADRAFEAAVTRWPDEPLVLFAAAGRHASARRWDAAASTYRSLLGLEPRNAAARNNLANVLAEQGCPAAAREQARAALELIEPDSPLQPAIEDTLASIDAAGSAAEAAGCAAL